jgi:ABC-type oligopeptide transport system substrate-binding subunit
VSLPLEFEGAAPLSGDNETNWNNPQFNALVAKGAAAPKVAVANGYYKQAEKMLSLQGGAIIPVFFDTVAAVRSTCAGYSPSDDFGQYDFTRLTCS